MKKRNRFLRWLYRETLTDPVLLRRAIRIQNARKIRIAFERFAEVSGRLAEAFDCAAAAAESASRTSRAFSAIFSAAVRID